MTRTAWRFFPHAMVASIGMMVLVDGGLAFTALRSFPGRAAEDVFDHSNSYNDVLDIAAQEASLGWTLEAGLQGGAAMLRLADRAGRPVRGAAIRGTAMRPLGASHSVVLTFHEQAPGIYLADVGLTLPGQWELRLLATAAAGSVHATRRVIVK